MKSNVWTGQRGEDPPRKETIVEQNDSVIDNESDILVPTIPEITGNQENSRVNEEEEEGEGEAEGVVEVEVEEEETTSNHYHIRSSRLGCLLLHTNQTTKADIVTYNPPLNMPVNVRHHVMNGKFCIENDILTAMMDVKTKNGLHPLFEGGTFTGVLASFESSKGVKSPLTKLSPIVNISAHETNIHGVPATETILSAAIKWLTGSDYEESTNNLFSIYLSKMTELNIPNAPTNTLREFIASRVWNGDLWWGESEDFLKYLRSELKPEDPQQQRLMIRYITSNLARMTKVFICPQDSQHRVAVADMAVHGIIPKTAPTILQEKFQTFVTELKYLEAYKGGPIVLESELFDPDIQFKISNPQLFDENFILDAKNCSADSQTIHETSSPHHILNVLDTILGLVVRPINDDDKLHLHFLYRDEAPEGEVEHGLIQVLNLSDSSDITVDLKNRSFREILIRDGLADNTEQFNEDDFGEYAASKADYYIKRWMSKWTWKFYHIIKKILLKLPNFKGVEVLRGVPDMGIESFQWLWKKCERNNDEEETQQKQFCIDMIAGGLESLLPTLPLKSSSDPFSKSPYTLAINKNKKKRQNRNEISPELLDLLYTTTYACLSKKSYETIRRFARGGSEVVIQGGEETPDHASRMLRLCVLAVNTITKCSHDIWDPGYFSRNLSNTPVRCNKHKKAVGWLLVQLSAIKHVYEYVTFEGLNPFYQPDKEAGYVDFLTLMEVNSAWTVGTLAKKDPIVYFFLDFYASIIVEERWRKNLGKGGARDAKIVRKGVYPILEQSIISDLSLSNLTVTPVSTDLRTHWQQQIGHNELSPLFLGELSVGSLETGSTELNRTIESLRGVDENIDLVEVLGNGGDAAIITHRPSQHRTCFLRTVRILSDLRVIAVPPEDDGRGTTKKKNSHEKHRKEEESKEVTEKEESKEVPKKLKRKGNQKYRTDGYDSIRDEVRLALHPKHELGTLPTDLNDFTDEEQASLAQAGLKMLLLVEPTPTKTKRRKTTSGNSKNLVEHEAKVNELDGSEDDETKPENANQYNSEGIDDLPVDESYNPAYRLVGQTNHKEKEGKTTIIPPITFPVVFYIHFLFETQITNTCESEGKGGQTKNLKSKTINHTAHHFL